MRGKVGARTKLANTITKTWLDLLKPYKPRLEAEYRITKDPNDDLNEKIDVVDTVAGVAYEMKVSPNNPHMEFYRDIFKVILARNKRLAHLKHFVFLTPKKGADKLDRGMGHAVKQMGPACDLKIKVEAL